MAEGHYVKCPLKPSLVSALGAIQKESGGIRLIHDCSRPVGRAVNDLAEDVTFKYQTFEDAVKNVKQGSYLAKVDLKNAYRSIPISKESQEATGISWVFGDQKIYMKDVRLPFGAKLSPFIFNKITQAVVRMMIRKGFKGICAYLDDFIIITDSKDECTLALNTLIYLLRSLGFMINWSKVEGPTNHLSFLGIVIDSLSMTCSIPAAKMCQIKTYLDKFVNRKRASKKQLQSLIGRLSWVAKVVPAGRIYLRSLINGMSVLKNPDHKIVLTKEMLADLDWWMRVGPKLNGIFPIKDDRPVTSLVTDACTIGGAGVFEGDWFYVNWQQDCPEMANLHINYKEALCVVLAARRWAPWWCNKKIVVYTDSMVARGMLAKARAKDSCMVTALKELFMLSAIYNFQIIPRYIVGKDNLLADRISRIHDVNAVLDLLSLFPLYGMGALNCDVYNNFHHMSEVTLCSLYKQASILTHGTMCCPSK